MKPRTIDALLQGHSEPPVWLGAVDGATSRLTLVVEAPARKANRQCEGAVYSCLITAPKRMSVGAEFELFMPSTAGNGLVLQFCNRASAPKR